MAKITKWLRKNWKKYLLIIAIIALIITAAYFFNSNTQLDSVAQIGTVGGGGA